jgi:hypothetical protein
MRSSASRFVSSNPEALIAAVTVRQSGVARLLVVASLAGRAAWIAYILITRSLIDEGDHADMRQTSHKDFGKGQPIVSALTGDADMILRSERP